MHEVSLATAVINLATEQATAAQARRVTRLVLEIGALSHVDPRALRLAVSVAALGGPAEGAMIDILEPAGTAYCVDCERSVAILQRGEPCPQCGGGKLLVQSGDAMRLKELEVV